MLFSFSFLKDSTAGHGKVSFLLGEICQTTKAITECFKLKAPSPGFTAEKAVIGPTLPQGKVFGAFFLAVPFVDQLLKQNVQDEKQF